MRICCSINTTAYFKDSLGSVLILGYLDVAAVWASLVLFLLTLCALSI